MTATSRIRTRGGYVNSVASYTATPSMVVTNTTQPVGTYETMSDVVTRPFIPGKTIANRDMIRSQVTKSATPVSGAVRLEGVPNRTDSYIGSYFTNRDAELDAVGALINIDTSGLVAQACTQALANVRQPELSGLVSLAEARETIRSLLNPVNGALKWLSRNAPTKKKPSRKQRKMSRTKRAALELKNTARDVTDQHLSIIFGLMPFISDVQSTLKALEAVEPLPVRFTARGSASTHDRRTRSTVETFGNDGSSHVERENYSQADYTYTVRAYQLYEASVSLQNALGVSPSDIPKAMWQTATLSFVVDWFANVGDYISAITPQDGIRMLASGYTVTAVQSLSTEYSEKRIRTADAGWAGSFDGGNQSRVTLTKSRVTGSLGDHVRIVAKSNMHHSFSDDAFKVSAACSLLTQRLLKLL